MHLHRRLPPSKCFMTQVIHRYYLSTTRPFITSGDFHLGQTKLISRIFWAKNWTERPKKRKKKKQLNGSGC